MSHYTSSSRRSSTESRLSIPHFPSARNFKISPGKFISRTFTKWLKSPEARSDGVDRLTILSVAWGKSNKVPSHEYLVVTLRNCSSSLRVERDSDSRSTLWSPKSRSSSKDTITIADHFLDLVGRDDTILASFAFKHPTVPLISLSTLLELISQQSDKYTLWTFNCWWYVGCLWRNLAKRAKGSDGVCFRMNEEVDEVRRFADEGGEAWDAIGFGQVLQFVHLAALERTWYRDSKAPKSQLKKVSDDIDQMFSQSCGRMEKGKVFGRDKLRVLILSQSEPSKSAFLPDAFRDAVVDPRDINQEIELASYPDHIFHLLTMVPGQNSQLISQFMNERTHVECPLTERLDGIWYCKNIPVDEACAFDEEDEIILNTFGDVPVTIVFIGMNALASRLKAQHLARVGKDRNLRVVIGERTRRTFEATCTVPLMELCRNRAPEAITLKKVSVFHERGTRDGFCELVRTTSDSLHRYRASRAAEYCFRLCLLREYDPDETWSLALDKGRSVTTPDMAFLL